MGTKQTSRSVLLLSPVLVTALTLARLSVGAVDDVAIGEPSDLTCELMLHPQLTEMCDPRPEFGWVVGSSIRGDIQTAYQVLVSSSQESLARDEGDIVDWPHGNILGLQGGYGETDGFEFKPIAQAQSAPAARQVTSKAAAPESLPGAAAQRIHLIPVTTGGLLLTCPVATLT